MVGGGGGGGGGWGSFSTAGQAVMDEGEGAESINCVTHMRRPRMWTIYLIDELPVPVAPHLPHHHYARPVSRDGEGTSLTAFKLAIKLPWDTVQYSVYI